jgi:hypothetical protein
VEGWRRVRDARGGRTGTHHVTDELDLPDGRTLRTRISHPPDRTDYGASLFAHILRDQLAVSETEFWVCVGDGVPPERGVLASSSVSIPADLVHLLIHRVGLHEDDVKAMSRHQAIARARQYWSQGH